MLHRVVTSLVITAVATDDAGEAGCALQMTGSIMESHSIGLEQRNNNQHTTTMPFRPSDATEVEEADPSEEEQVRVHSLSQTNRKASKQEQKKIPFMAYDEGDEAKYRAELDQHKTWNPNPAFKAKLTVFGNELVRIAQLNEFDLSKHPWLPSFVSRFWTPFVLRKSPDMPFSPDIDVPPPMYDESVIAEYDANLQQQKWSTSPEFRAKLAEFGSELVRLAQLNEFDLAKHPWLPTFVSRFWTQFVELEKEIGRQHIAAISESVKLDGTETASDQLSAAIPFPFLEINAYYSHAPSPLPATQNNQETMLLELGEREASSLDPLVHSKLMELNKMLPQGVQAKLLQNERGTRR